MTTKEAQGLPQDTLVAEIEAGSIERLDADGILLGRMPTILEKKAAALIRSLSEANAALEVEAKKFEALFADCQLARDTAGFIGSVPECIEMLDGETKLLTGRAEAAEAALSAATAEIERLKGMHAAVLADCDTLTRNLAYQAELRETDLSTAIALDPKAVERAARVYVGQQSRNPDDCAYGHGSISGSGDSTFHCDVTWLQAAIPSVEHVIRAYLSAIAASKAEAAEQRGNDLEGGDDERA